MRTRNIGSFRAAMNGKPRPGESRWAAAAIGVIGSLVLHALLVNALLTGGIAARVPRQVGLGADTIVSDESARGTLILIETSAVAEAGSDLPQPASKGTQLHTARLTIVSPVEVPEPAFDLGQEAASETDSAESADHIGRAQQFGIYMRQIQARIERIWLRPRSPIGGGSFSCRAQILQSERGEVLEVTLQDCDADPHWQQSLVRAIERASPLPAPPDPVVFSEFVQLGFHTNAFEPGGSAEGFEPSRPAMLTHEMSQVPGR